MTTKATENKGGYKLKHLIHDAVSEYKDDPCNRRNFPNHVLTEEFVNPKTGEHLVIGQQFCFCS